MRYRLGSLRPLVVSLLLVLLTSTIWAEERAVYQFVRFGDITSQNGPAGEMVDAEELSCRQKARRVLVESPLGRRLILESLWIPSTGVSQRRLVDDATGWWIEIREVTSGHFELPSLAAFGNSTWMQAKMMKALERGSTAELRAHEAASFEVDLEPYEPAGPALALQAAARGVPAGWQTELDPDLRQALRFLFDFYQTKEGGGASMLGEFEGLFTVVRLALPAQKGKELRPRLYRFTPLELTEEEGLIPRAQALASRFTTLASPVDLLSGLHAPENGGCPSATGE